jgi:choline kinase
VIEISEAVVLMAGSGSRLRTTASTVIKPLVPILGRPLISYTFDALRHAGIRTVYAVVGFESDIVSRLVEPLAPPDLALRFIENPDWNKQNGISVLAAAPHVKSPFVLTMSDHVFDQSILDLLIRRGAPDRLHLTVDRKLDSICDRDDAMKVQTRGEQIVTLGKDLREYDAIDTGLFLCTADLFDHLEQARQRAGGDCSLADGVRSMAATGKARAIDIGAAWWQDVDTPEMLACAEQHLRERSELAEGV